MDNYTQYFEMKKLVLVDSAGFCYLELPIDEHGILVGEGNIGKSSILNALKLFLLPENSFRDCERKFNFRTPDKSICYSAEDSYTHYFPKDHSFLILESKNLRGTYCQILYKGAAGKLHFNRIFVPCAYEKLRSLFWTVSAEDQYNIGQAVDNLSKKLLLDTLKNKFSQIVIESEPTKLKNILYSNDFKEMQYCIFPLKEINDICIESLRTLIILLFDMNIRPIKSAIANIIETEKKSIADIFNFNVDNFITKHNELNEQKQKIIHINNFKNLYHKLDKNYQDYLEADKSKYELLLFAKKLEEVLSNIIEEKQKISFQHEFHLPKQQELIRKYDNLVKDMRKNEGGKGEIQRNNLKNSKIIQEVDKSLNMEYSGLSFNDAHSRIKEQIEFLTKHLNALKDDSAREERCKELKHSIETKEKKIASLKENLERQHYQLVSQLPEQIWQPLAAINKKLVNANPLKPLEEKQRQSIENFVDLFERKGHDYLFFGESFSTETSKPENLHEQIKQLQEKLEQDRDEREKLDSNKLTFQEIRKEIQKNEKLLDSYISQNQSFNKYNYALNSIKENEERLSELNKEYEMLEEDLKITKLEKEDIDIKTNKLKDQLAQKNKEMGDFNLLKDKCKKLKTKFIGLDIEPFNFTEANMDLSISPNKLDYIEKNLENQNHLFKDIIYQLKGFIAESIIQDTDHIRSDAPTFEQVQDTFQRLAKIYEELPSNESELEKETLEHNNSVSNHTRMLKDNYEFIKRFETQINRSFESVKINDLEGIKINISIDQRFKNLVEDIQRIDPYSKINLPSKQFYDRLKSFVTEFNDNKLKMNNVITSVNYETFKSKEKIWQTKHQSESTVALINLELVQILLKKIMSEPVRLPLIMDEASRIDIGQFDWLLSHIKSRGFNLFAAVTYSTSTELLCKVKQYHEIGNMRTSKPYSKERNLVYWNGGEFFTDIAIQQIKQLGFI